MSGGEGSGWGKKPRDTGYYQFCAARALTSSYFCRMLATGREHDRSVPAEASAGLYRHLTESDDTLAAVMRWFYYHSAVASLKIHASIEGVSDEEFEFVSRRLASNALWTSDTTAPIVEVACRGVKYVHAPEVSMHAYARQDDVEGPADVVVAVRRSAHVTVRFCVTREVMMDLPGDLREQCTRRMKSRRTFVHKHRVAYELATADAGGVAGTSPTSPTSATSSVRHEVRLAWCGHGLMQHEDAPSTQDAAIGFLSKVDDVVGMVLRCRAAH